MTQFYLLALDDPHQELEEEAKENERIEEERKEQGVGVCSQLFNIHVTSPNRFRQGFSTNFSNFSSKSWLTDQSS